MISKILCSASIMIILSNSSQALELKESAGLLTKYEVQVCENKDISIQEKEKDIIELEEAIEVINKDIVNLNDKYVKAVALLDDFKNIMDRNSKEDIEIYNLQLNEIDSIFSLLEKEEESMKSLFEEYKNIQSQLYDEVNNFNFSCGNSEYSKDL